MAKSPNPSADEKPNRKRESILDAAARVFQDEGYEGASMDRIAEVAGASKRTVYNHFPSKETLFQAVVERFVVEMTALKRIPYDRFRSLEEQLGEFADAELSLVGNPQWLGLTKVLLSVFVRDPVLARDTMGRYAGGESSLTAWIRAAEADGRLSAAEPALASGVFSAMLTGAFTWPAILQTPLGSEASKVLKRELIETFLSRYQKQRPEG